MFKRLSLLIKFYLTSLARFVYPSFCVFCDKALTLTENYCCRTCIRQLPILRAPTCKKCASELPPFAALSYFCLPCRRAKTFYDCGTAYFRYEGKIKSIFQNIKFENKSWYLKIFRRFLKPSHLPFSLQDYDVIVPVPLDRRRMQVREFNQSELIAKLIGNLDGAPPMKRLLKKIKQTDPQSLLQRKERLKNLDQAFRLKRNQSVAGKKILIVDDIVTTGATINECARILKLNGAAQVDFFALAKTTHWLN